MSEESTTSPASDPPGDKVYICPACGLRYDEPTTCSNGHPPTETVEYDRATVEASDAGDADAQAKIAEQALANEEIGASAGVTEDAANTSPAQAVEPTPPFVAPAAADPAGDQPGTGTPPGGATDVANPAPTVADPSPAPAATETDVEATAPTAVPVSVSITYSDGSTYSGSISAA